MSAKDTSPPAFPLADSCCEYGGTNRSDANGMTLRDYFAAKALTAIMAPNPATGAYPQADEFHACASLAYQMADAMLEASKQ